MIQPIKFTLNTKKENKMSEEHSLSRVWTIDPSIAALGWAIGRVYEGSCGVYERSSYVNPPKDVKNAPWVDKIDFMSDYFRRMLDQSGDPDVVLIELPRHYSGGVASTAAKNSGAILKLIGLVFTLREMFLHVGDGDIEVILVPVEKWKGSTPKAITQKRIVKHWNIQFKDHNEADAVGIFDWYVRSNLKIRATKLPSLKSKTKWIPFHPHASS